MKSCKDTRGEIAKGLLLRAYNIRINHNCFREYLLNDHCLGTSPEDAEKVKQILNAYEDLGFWTWEAKECLGDVAYHTDKNNNMKHRLGDDKYTLHNVEIEIFILPKGITEALNIQNSISSRSINIGSLWVSGVAALFSLIAIILASVQTNKVQLSILKEKSPILNVQDTLFYQPSDSSEKIQIQVEIKTLIDTMK